MQQNPKPLLQGESANEAGYHRCKRVVSAPARHICRTAEDSWRSALREREREKQREKEREREKPLYSRCCRQGERARATAVAQPVERG